jgi:ABC-2 type transport system permease protein
MLAFLASLAMSFLLGFFLEATLGMIGFWFLEVSSLLLVYMLMNFFLSGHMFPLDMMPGHWSLVMKIIPLQYLAYFPAAVFLQKVSGWDLAWGLAVEAFWVAFFYVSARTMFHYGVRRYSAYGG